VNHCTPEQEEALIESATSLLLDLEIRRMTGELTFTPETAELMTGLDHLIYERNLRMEANRPPGAWHPYTPAEEGATS
jgi:hypothetical protein